LLHFRFHKEESLKRHGNLAGFDRDYCRERYIALFHAFITNLGVKVNGRSENIPSSIGLAGWRYAVGSAQRRICEFERVGLLLGIDVELECCRAGAQVVTLIDDIDNVVADSLCYGRAIDAPRANETVGRKPCGALIGLGRRGSGGFATGCEQGCRNSEGSQNLDCHRSPLFNRNIYKKFNVAESYNAIFQRFNINGIIENIFQIVVGRPPRPQGVKG